MAAPATISDLQARALRPLTDIETEKGQQLLDDAYTVMVARQPSIDARITAGPTPAFLSLVKQIQCAMVLRVMSNPEGKLEETSDDYTYRLDAAVSTGALYLSNPEMTLLAPAGGAGFTIKPAGASPDPVNVPSMWYPF